MAAGVIYHVIRLRHQAANLDVGVGDVLTRAVIDEFLPRPFLPFGVALEKAGVEVIFFLAFHKGEGLVKLLVVAVALVDEDVHSARRHLVEWTEEDELVRDDVWGEDGLLQEADFVVRRLLLFVNLHVV